MGVAMGLGAVMLGLVAGELSDAAAVFFPLSWCIQYATALTRFGIEMNFT